MQHKTSIKLGADASTTTGHVVVIDVLRAFTTAAFAFSKGAEKIILVSTPEEAFELKKRDRNLILIGEVGGKPVNGFDYGNSPEKIDSLDLTRKTIVLRSSSGTQGVTSAKQAQQKYLGSLVVAQATVRYLKKHKVTPITFLAMTTSQNSDFDEDMSCAKYMHSLMIDKWLDSEDIVRQVKQSPAGQAALDPSIDWKTPGDLERATRIDCFNFAMPVTFEDGLWVARAAYL